MAVSLQLEISLDSKGAVSGVKSLDTAIGGLDKSTQGADKAGQGLTKSVFLGTLAYQAASKAASLFTGFLKGSITESMESERVTKALASALEITGRPVESLSKHFDEYAKQLQSVTIYDDEAIKKTQTLLIQLTNLDKDGLDKATKGAIGLAAVMGGDLGGATSIVTKAMTGNTTALTRLGITVDTTKSKEEQRNEVLNKLVALYPRATAEAQTHSGQLAQMANQYHDMQEAAGDALLKGLQPLMDLMRDKAVLNAFATAITGITTALAFLVKGWGLIVVATVKAVGTITSKYDQWKRSVINIQAAQEQEIALILKALKLKGATIQQMNEWRAAASLDFEQAKKLLYQSELGIGLQEKYNEVHRQAAKATAGTSKAINDLSFYTGKSSEAFDMSKIAIVGLNSVLDKSTSGTNKFRDATQDLIDKKKADEAATQKQKIATWEATQATDKYRDSIKGLDAIMDSLINSEFEIAATFKLSTASTDANTFSLNQNKQAAFNLSGVMPVLEENIKKTDTATKKWSINWQDTNEVMGFAKSMMGEIGNALSALGIDLGETGNAFMSLVDGNATFIQGFISKNPLTMIAGAVKILTAKIKLFSKDGVLGAIKAENQWMDLTKQQIKQLKELEKQYGSVHAATSDMLDQIINNADINIENFDEYADRLRGILSDFDQGTMTLSQTQKQMSDAFDALIAKAQDLGTEGSASLIGMFEDLKNRGINVKEIAEYIAAQMASGLEGYKSMKDAMDPGDLNEKYNALVESMKGMDVGSAEYIKAQAELEKLKLGITDVANAQAAFGGMNIKVYEDMIAYENKVAANPALTNAIAGATQALIGLSNTTRLSEDQFDQFEKSASTAFEKLTASGFTSKEAYQQLAPMLARLKFLHEQYGLVLDEETQKLLDGADAAGVNTDQAMSQEEAFGRMTGALEQMVVLMGGTLPGATQNAIKAIEKFAGTALTAFDSTTKAVYGFSDALDDATKERTLLINTENEYSNNEKPPKYAASGFFSPRLSSDTLIQAHKGEYVNIVPASQTKNNQSNITVADHSILTIHVDPKSGIDQNALAETLKIIIANNRQTVVDTMAAAVARKL